VLRCCHCQGVLLVITGQGDKRLVSFAQTKWLEISKETAIS
jgi:hypothetical protein